VAGRPRPQGVPFPEAVSDPSSVNLVTLVSSIVLTFILAAGPGASDVLREDSAAALIDV
jgi:hypothetical protein